MEVSEEQCRFCGEYKPYTSEYFTKLRRKSGTLGKECIKCNSQARSVRKKGVHLGVDKFADRVCSCCGETMQHWLFNDAAHVLYKCKICLGLEDSRIYPPEGFTVCSVCNEVKSSGYENFYKGLDKNRQLAPCRSCSTKVKHDYYHNNRERIRVEKSLKYREDIEANRKKRRDEHHRRKQNDTMYLLVKRYRSLVQNAFKRTGTRKSSKSLQMLGCTKDEFLKHIESQFVGEMGWAYWSDIDIDHIIPLSTAKSEEDVLMLNHYSNLKPMWSEYNAAKKDLMPSEWEEYKSRHGIDETVRPINHSLAN